MKMIPDIEPLRDHSLSGLIDAKKSHYHQKLKLTDYTRLVQKSIHHHILVLTGTLLKSYQ